MITTKPVSKGCILECMKRCNINTKKFNLVEEKLKNWRCDDASNIMVGADEAQKYTVVIINETSVGIAKRCTHAKRGDEYNEDRGITIATLRALGLSKE
jgi:hypothetical protein